MSADTIRIATFNASLNRATEGELVADLSARNDQQARTVAEILQRLAADIVLVNEFDYDADGAAVDLFRDNYLERRQNTLGLADHGGKPIHYDYAFTAPSNTGIASGFDLNNNGETVTVPGAAGYGDDALGFGAFPGQYGMAIFSKYEILTDQVRTFQTFLWKDMPDARLPDDPNTAAPNDWYSAEELEVMRLSSKSHWDVPILVDGEVIHVIVSHPTPPTFDGAEDRNGLRNADEIRFLSDYVTPGQGDYIYDDAGNHGGLEAGERFVILGDMNADPHDGDSADNAIHQLLDNPLIDGSLVPTSAGGPEQATLQGGANADHQGDPSQDTADFADGAPGNLRADYVLPSASGLTPVNAEVFWPESTDPTFPLVGAYTPSLPGGFPSSDHRAVAMDLTIDRVFPTLSGDAPTVIGHRGASGSRPEHTLEAYRLAIELGADVIEPDLVVTKDGHLIDRHEPMLSGTTDIAEHPEFADRKTTKVIEGETVTDWFAEDFTLAEIKTLRAVERIPQLRPDSADYNGLYEIPTLDEVIALVKQVEAETGRQIGIIPETKHPTYFEYNGVYQDRTPIHVDTSRLLIDTLVANGFTDPSRVSIQSFEIANLIELQTKIMPAAGIDVPLVQLMYNTYSPDLLFHLDPANAALGADPSLYDGFTFPLTAGTVAEAGGGGLYSAEAFAAMAALYAEAISPLKEDIFLVTPLATPVDGDGDGIPLIFMQLTGEVVPMVQWAHDNGLELVVYTMRDEEYFSALNPDGTARRPVEEYVSLVEAGVDGIFSDFPGSARVVVDQLKAGAGAIALGNLQGGNDILLLDAGALNRRLASEGRDTVIYGGDAKLNLSAGLEDAELRGTGDAIIHGNGLDNALDGNAGANELHGGVGHDTLSGLGGDDLLAGGVGDDLLLGGDGNDLLRSAAGNDTLAGGVGADTLIAGGGADVFRYGSAAEGGDHIHAFEWRIDVIEVSAGGFGGGLVAGQALEAGQFTTSNLGLASGTEAQFIWEKDAKTLWWDADGTGAEAAVMIATFEHVHALAAANIAIIA
ncbi:endonuclease/exonuclease/phosphatase family protein [Roseomonas sp. HJA6]|uniref:glycerophosphodiester phosphodiesterase n=1 Tax=Roseomonas alba TaxID=2846776 RepID=A0ABS7A8I5_9PROT|nr:glycerophosphodiester phosphodiesterase family protein [Neoroseomonas alba]MBW6398606.1 endonuclease/exonuclease/phosphatase family protein [Neoroseomonas alba]